MLPWNCSQTPLKPTAETGIEFGRAKQCTRKKRTLVPGANWVMGSLLVPIPYQLHVQNGGSFTSDRNIPSGPLRATVHKKSAAVLAHFLHEKGSDNFEKVRLCTIRDPVMRYDRRIKYQSSSPRNLTLSVSLFKLKLVQNSNHYHIIFSVFKPRIFSNNFYYDYYKSYATKERLFSIKRKQFKATTKFVFFVLVFLWDDDGVTLKIREKRRSPF